MEINTRQLLDLRAGALLTVKLRSGRETKARLDKAPALRCVGKPGIHRVQLEVTDLAALGKLSDRAGIFQALDCRHTISGDRVVSVD